MEQRKNPYTMLNGRCLCIVTKWGQFFLPSVKPFVCLFSFILVATSLFCQDACGDIQKFYADQFFLIHDNQGKTVYCVHYQDTIKGTSPAKNIYEFRFNNDSLLVVRLSRMWDVLKPLWNTCLSSDTISLLPIGDIKYICYGDTIQLQGFKSAYVGPKYVSSRKKQKLK